MTWAITGTGLVSSLGSTVEESFEAFCRAETALAPLRTFDRSRYRIGSAYQMPDGAEVSGRASRWLCGSIGQALTQAGLAGADPGLRMPVVVGTGLAEQRSLELWWTAGAPLPPDRLHFAGAVASRFGPRQTLTLVNACSAGLFALAHATDLLALDEADAVVVAGTDALAESMVGLLDRVNAHPPAEVRPFDADRRGVLLGEGAGAVVVERLDRALARGAEPLALLRSVGTACDAHHVTAPLRAGIGRAFRDAHARAGITPAQVDLIMAHATGTQLNDETEALTLGDVFGPDTGRPHVTALKSLIGHTSGASGLMSLVVATAALRAGRVPPTRNCVTPIPEAARLRLVTGTARRADLRTAQVNAFGFGGVNAVAVLDRAGAGPAGTSAPVGGRVAVTAVGLAMPGFGTVDELLDGVRPPAAGDPLAILGQRGLRYKDRATRLALSAVASVLADAGLPVPGPGGEPDLSIGVVVSSTLGIAGTVCRVADTIHSGGVQATSPMDLPNVSGNVAASSIAIWFRLAGLNLTVSAGPTSGVSALHLATTAIRAGRARRMIVVGVEPGDEVAARLLGEASAGENGPPATPFDGAAAVLLEAVDAAEERGAGVLGLIGCHSHHARLETSVEHALPVPDHPLWLVPCLGHPGAPDRVAAVGPADWSDRLDLSGTVGEASGALGVLQCAVAARWLGRHRGRSALISSGGCWGEDFASLELRGAP